MCRNAPIALLALLVLSGTVHAGSLEPTPTWEFRAESNLYAPPLVADICPNPGLETILSDSEVRRLKCVDDTGKLIWEYNGGWTKRQTSSAALSMTARPGKGTLAVGNSDGTVNCLDAATGTELWKQNLGGIEWGGVLWADLNGDGQDELIVGTESKGVFALNTEGSKLWEYHGQDDKGLMVKCPLGAADIDSDSKAEIFGAGRFGPFCLNADGTLRWQTDTVDEYPSTVSIADADSDGTPEVYCCSANDNALWRFDARTGQAVWKRPLTGKADVYPSSCIAVGDVDQDGADEIVVGDQTGYVHCFRNTGELLWIFEAGKPTNIGASLGDVDGDGEVEVLAACGDHYLYCLNPEGVLEWKFKAGLRLIYAPTIADVDNDGKTDILFCGSDKTLRCLTLGGRYVPELVPWASRRFDTSQTGSSCGKRSAAKSELVSETVVLFDFGGFEMAKESQDPKEYPAQASLLENRAKQPRNWVTYAVGPSTWQIDAEIHCEGNSALKVIAGEKPFEFATQPINVERSLRSVSAGISFKGPADARCWIRWKGSQGVLREDPLMAGPKSADGWLRYEADEAPVPFGAKWVQLVCESPAGQEPVWWDDARVTGKVMRSRTVRALVNQVGYDSGAPKRFTAQSNFVAKSASFELVSTDGSVVFSGPLAHEGRITGAYGQDWGYEYWRGDFTAFDATGKYRIRVTFDGTTDLSWPFEVGEDVVWNGTSRPAYRFFYYQRCGMEIPGFHKACHLDDATSLDHQRQYELWGGWHDAGDYNKYHNAPYVMGLSNAYALRQKAFDLQDEDGNGISDFFDEILWGGDHARRMIAPDGSAFGPITSGYGFWAAPELETDNVPGTGDERPIVDSETGCDSAQHAVPLARIARFAKDKGPWVEAADRALKWALDTNRRGPTQFVTALELYAATGKEEYGTLAKELFPGPNVDILENIQLYDSVFKEDHSAQLREALMKRAEDILKLARNPFGVYTFGPAEKPNFFGTPPGTGGWHVGTSSHILEAAWRVAQAFEYERDPRYLTFVYDQLNYILGNNPFDISLMEGCGSAFPPTYHHRYTFSGVPRGAVPGSVVNGITWRGGGDDRPYFDMRGLDIPDFEPNEVWLPHNTNYLNALSTLYAARESNKPSLLVVLRQ